MSNKSYQSILKYFKFVGIYEGRFFDNKIFSIKINILQKIFYPLEDAKRFQEVTINFL